MKQLMMCVQLSGDTPNVKDWSQTGNVQDPRGKNAIVRWEPAIAQRYVVCSEKDLSPWSANIQMRMTMVDAGTNKNL